MQQTQYNIGEVFDYLNPAGNNRTSLLRLLRKMLLRLLVVSQEDQFYEYIGHCFQEIIPDSIVLINSFNETSNLFQLRAIVSHDIRIQRITALLGTNPLGMSLPINEIMVAELLDGRVKRVEDGIAGMFHGAVPAEYCHILQKYFGLTDVYIVGLSLNRALLGSASILVGANKALSDSDLVQSIATICGSVLYQGPQTTYICQ